MADSHDDDVPASHSIPDLDLSLSKILNRCQDQVARFIMLPEHYITYDKIMRDFLVAELSYVQFRRQMGTLLLQNPRYDHLRIYYEVLHRVLLREEQDGDDFLILWPAVTFVLLYTFLHSVQLRGTIWDHPKELGIERARILTAQWDLEWSRLQDRRYRPPGFYPQSDLPIIDPEPVDWQLNPEDFLDYFLSWCDELAMKMATAPEAYYLHTKISFDFCEGKIPYGQFENEMRELLQGYYD